MVFTGRSHRGSAWRLVAVALLAAASVGAASIGFVTQAKDSAPRAVVSLSSLPVEAQTVQRLIHAGGPFPYSKDGIVFGNRERLLPRHPRGYYREYTVQTPGSRDRGARRIVCGGQQATAPEACYYTDDHYASFRLIAQ